MTVVLPPDTGRAYQYTKSLSGTDKRLEPDGSVQTAAGTIVLPADTGRSWQYKQSPWTVDKLLEPDGSVVTAGSGSGTSNPPGGSSGQLQYNNGSGGFAGTAGILTDGTNLSIGGIATVVNPLEVGIAGVIGFQVVPPSGNIANPINVKPPGSGGTGSITSPSGWVIGAANGSTMSIGSSQGGQYMQFPCNSANINAFNFAGATSTNPPTLSTVGSDTNINLKLAPKGTGAIVIPIANVPVYASNTAAAAALPQGALYRSGADPDQLFIVH